MRFHKSNGFTIIELLIGLSIVVLLATITIFQLGSSRETGELRTAARQLTADIRAMQARALSAKNIKICDTGTNLAVCESSQVACGVNPCTDGIPAAYGLHLETSTSTYVLFADINPEASIDYHYTDAGEAYQIRSLMPLFGKDVVIDQIMSSTTSVTFADIAFMRQNGTARIYDITTPPESALLRIRIRHLKSNDTIEIEINRITGRISTL
ncbi:MAG: prepilin-type N-terminal cleavage/methylation domain-containing protein [Patescibacteria group bacterium]|nr:prepilin-type N-terminal cleavage/methylation domain-containing protein [Patescibacteria group bacterium]